ncbi:ATP-binding cassette domain-containing protein [Streptomyces sp. DH41]|uniref:ATP-binding cassette domain-containing protein n=1 Tax=Streptomyces sp. DH41 TaxID=3040125 RepID=UPI00244220B0|nr:ATP-binding cassette domain-containing protein [Streptomyces sp. DH41]MDG9724375.1 ATP-binding cassette domain-containing protein [Streptomyces sp. DH41]
MTASLLEVEDLRLSYRGRGLRVRPKEVLHGVSLTLAEGEALGLVGESGSGKTTIGRAILGLARPSAGRIVWNGQNITYADRKERRLLARDIQVVFQDPYTSLNPSLTIGDILTEPLVARGAKSADARRTVGALLDQVGLPSDASERLPREFSGGQRQRVAIARALAPEPKLIVCDEPVSALDLSTQARVMDLLIDIQRRTGVAYLFISHDLSVVRHISHRVAVLHQGELVETGTADQVTSRPEHPYTQRLVLSSPVADPVEQEKRRNARAQLLAAAGQSGSPSL